MILQEFSKYLQANNEKIINNQTTATKLLCDWIKYVINKNLIKRIKDTKPQYQLKRPERMRNLSGAFSVDKEKYNGKTILIIDDICTTGSTFEEMIKALNKENIYDITCFATTTPWD